jgi:hypothetical protein
VHVVVSQQDPQGELERADGDPAELEAKGDPAEGDSAEGFGGEHTGVAPDDSRSSRWDRDAQDEDALLRRTSSAEERGGHGSVSG